jgi:Lysine 2,3-aminomutase
MNRNYLFPAICGYVVFDMIFQMQVKKELWRSYHWQIQNRVKTQEELESVLKCFCQRKLKCIKRTQGIYPLAITPYYLSLIDPQDPQDPISASGYPKGGGGG